MIWRNRWKKSYR